MILPKIEKAETLGAMVNAFRPEPLKENELAEFYCSSTMPIRTGDLYTSPMEDLFEDCTSPRAANAHLLLGHRGCGKSTELYHLKKRIEDAGQPAWIIDFESEMDVFQANCWDVMLAVMEGLCKIAEQKKLRGLDKTLTQVSEYLKADRETTKESNYAYGIAASAGAETKAPPILKSVINLFATIKGELKANAETRVIIKNKMERRASEWIKYVNELSALISGKLKGMQPVIIFENVDRIQPPGKAMEIFQYHALAQMPFPVIYTFPISLYYDSNFSAIKDYYKPHILPMIEVSHIDNSENTEGVSAIREIVALRANPGLFDDDALQTLIMKTGGVLRDLFRCIVSSSRRANRRGADKIEMQDAEVALSMLRSEIVRSISQPDYSKLANIYRDKMYKEQIEDAQFLLRQMQALVVLEYNKTRWHDLHPLIAEFLIEQGLIAEERGGVHDAGR